MGPRRDGTTSENPAIRGRNVPQMTLQPCETCGGFIEKARRVVQHHHFTRRRSERVLSRQLREAHPEQRSASAPATAKKKVFLHKSGGGKQRIRSQRSVSCFPRVRDKPMSAHTPPVCMVYTHTHTHVKSAQRCTVCGVSGGTNPQWPCLHYPQLS